VLSLADVAALPRDRAPGAVVAWLHDALLPALVEDVTPDGDLETRVIRAATRPTDDRPARPIVWEGLPYRAAPGAVAAEDALAIRRATRGPRLDRLVELHRARPSAEADAAPAGDARLSELLSTIDSLSDQVLPSLLYALAVAPASDAILYVEAWRTHGLRQPDRHSEILLKRPWRVVAWQPPVLEVRPGGGVGVVGAYLGLDVALAHSQLVRLPSGDVPGSGALADDDSIPVVQGLAVTRAEDFARPESARAVEILSSGRAQVAAWRSAGTGGRALTALLRRGGVDEWRSALIGWSAARGDGSAFDVLTPSEIFRLGGAGDLPAAWAGASMSIDGCLCRLAARPLTREDLRGRRLGLQALMVHDLPLRLAEHLASLQLDVSLVPLVLPAATQDWLDHARLRHPDDWESAAAWPRDLTRDRVEEYLLHLVTTGVLAPPPAEDVVR
jgi:hypothetical protein